MQRQSATCRRGSSLIFLVVLAVALVAPSPSLARVSLSGQEASSQAVGASMVTFGADWVRDTANTDPDSIRLSHLEFPSTAYLFSDFADPAATDTSMVFDEFDEGFFSGFGDGDHQVVASGMVAPSMAWRLYSVGQEGIPFGLLVTADVITRPGRVLMSVLLAPEGAFGGAAQAVRDTIDLDGTGSPLAGVDPAQLDAALTGTGQAGPTPTPAGPRTIPTLMPTAAATSDITVAGVTIRHGDSWVYDDVNSIPDERLYLDASDGSLRFYGFDVEEDSGIDAVSARDFFTQAYFSSLGATSVQQLAADESPNGTAWSLHRVDLSGEQILVLVYTDVVSVVGQLQIHQLVTDPDDMPTALTEAQASIQVGGAPAFPDLDPATVAARLEGGDVASLPEVYLGTWEGTGTEADPSVTWPISVTFAGGGIDAVVGTATYPTLDCSGDVILRHIDPATGTIEVMEDITAGEVNCVDGGTFLFAAAGGGQQLSFTWTSPDGTGSAEGTLSPMQLSSHSVGASTLSFSSDWILDADSTDAESIRLTHAEIPSTAYLYMEFPASSATDTSAVFAEFDTGFFNGFGDGDQQVVASGALAPSTDWRLYAVRRDGVPFGVLVTADITTQPGRILTSVVLAPADGFGSATQAVLDTIDRNGTGSPLAGVDPAALEAELAGGVAGE